MASGIVYLDIDDEITSAATRIRNMAERRVALVLPYGSRVATSRINFRLLSRDAMISEKQLAVVAGDSATRALAASAGLPVFASVGEYESSQEEATSATDAVPAVAGSESGPASDTVVRPAKRPRRGPTAKPAKADAAREHDLATAAEPTATAAPRPAPDPLPSPPTARPDAAMPPEPRDDTVQVEIPWVPLPPPEAAWRSAATAARSEHRPQRRQSPGRPSRLPIVIVAAALALVVLAGGVAAYVVLPTVSIVVTPRAEPIALPEIMITADPTITEPDAADRVVPAVPVPVEVTVNDFFPATGKRVEEAAAKGAVQFSNLDFLRSNVVPAGSIVSTGAGARFETVAAVTVPRADLVGLTVFPGKISVNVVAVEPGTEGNVEPNTIVIVPRGEDPEALKVVNPDALAGGTHDEFPQVTQDDVDAALQQLTSKLETAFGARVADPSIGPPGATVFPETASLGEPAATVDVEALVGQEVETFELGLRATGSVLTADPAPVKSIAESLLRGTVDAEHQLAAGSIRVQVGAPVVSGQSVTFPVTARAQVIRVLDPDSLRTLVMGKSLEAAKDALEPFGDVALTSWPDWVGAVPTLVERVDLRIDRSVEVEGPAASEPPS